MAILNASRSAAFYLAVILFTAASYRAATTPVVATSLPTASPEAVYAAFTLNLTRFVTWPEASFPTKDSPLVIGTFPRDPINEELDEAGHGEVVNGRPIRTVRIESLDDLESCHVIFMSHSFSRQAAVLARIANRPILTISDSDAFLMRGGHVRFVPEPPHTKLRISVENLKRSGLECRAQLLRIASAQ